jgi:hypothetical protein
MNSWLLASALAALVTFLVHLIVGGREIAAPLMRASGLARIPRLTTYYCWHMVSILLLAMAIALGWAAWHANPPLVLLLVLLAAAFAVLSLGLVVAFRVSPWHLPQWLFFVLIALLGAVGLAT